MKCRTQRQTCRNFNQQQSELCKYCTVLCWNILQPFAAVLIIEADIYIYILLPNISCQIQDPLVLLDPVCLRETLLEWLPVLERVLGPETAGDDAKVDEPGEDYLNPCSGQQEECSCSPDPTASIKAEEEKDESEEDQCDAAEKEPEVLNWSPVEPVRVVPPKPIPADLLDNLTQLATLYTELSCFRNQKNEQALGCTTFLRRYFCLLDKERVRRMCLLCYQEQPEVQSSFTEAMQGQMPLLKSFDYISSTLFIFLI